MVIPVRTGGLNGFQFMVPTTTIPAIRAWTAIARLNALVCSQSSRMPCSASALALERIERIAHQAHLGNPGFL